MKLYVADFLADTEHLSGEQSYAYLGILMGLWRHKGKLPFEHRVLRNLARCDPRRWSMVWKAIEAFFVIKDGEISQGRLTAEFEKAEQLLEKRKAEIAKKQAQAAWRAKKPPRDVVCSGSNPLENNNVVPLTSNPSGLTLTESNPEGGAEARDALEGVASPREEEANDERTKKEAERIARRQREDAEWEAEQAAQAAERERCRAALDAHIAAAEPEWQAIQAKLRAEGSPWVWEGRAA